jgi:hypothetical protein
VNHDDAKPFAHRIMRDRNEGRMRVLGVFVVIAAICLFFAGLKRGPQDVGRDERSSYNFATLAISVMVGAGGVAMIRGRRRR